MKKKLKRILFSLLILLVLLAVLLGLLFSNPLRFTYTVPEAEADNARLGELIDILADASADKDGNIPEIIQINLPPEIVNALLRLASYHLNGRIRETGIRCFLVWDKDQSSIRAAVSYDLPLSLELALRANVSPSVENGVAHLPVAGLRAGNLPVPAFLLPLPRSISDGDLKDDSQKQMLAAIHHLSPKQDGSIEAGIYPEKISNLIRFLKAQQDTPSSPE